MIAGLLQKREALDGEKTGEFETATEHDIVSDQLIPLGCLDFDLDFFRSNWNVRARGSFILSLSVFLIFGLKI